MKAVHSELIVSYWSVSGMADCCWRIWKNATDAFVNCYVTTPQGCKAICLFLLKVLHVIRGFSVHDKGISLHDLKTKLNYLSMREIRCLLTSSSHLLKLKIKDCYVIIPISPHTAYFSLLSLLLYRSSLVLLVNEGHIVSTLDEHHFKATEQ